VANTVFAETVFGTVKTVILSLGKPLPTLSPCYAISETLPVAYQLGMYTITSHLTSTYFLMQSTVIALNV